MEESLRLQFSLIFKIKWRLSLPQRRAHDARRVRERTRVTRTSSLPGDTCHIFIKLPCFIQSRLESKKINHFVSYWRKRTLTELIITHCRKQLRYVHNGKWNVWFCIVWFVWSKNGRHNKLKLQATPSIMFLCLFDIICYDLSTYMCIPL